MNKLIRNEIAKMKHRQIGITSALLIGAVVFMSLVGAAAGGADELSWAAILAGASLAFPMACPLLLAVIASRAVDMEHEGSGWLANQVFGSGPGTICLAKFLTTGFTVAISTLTASALLMALGTFLGADSLPLGLWMVYTLAIMAINLVILGIQVFISALVETQLIPLGIGIVGTVIAAVASGLPSWLAMLTPWGHYSLVAAAEYQGENLVTLAPSYSPVVVLVVLACAVFALIIRRLNTKEI